MAFEKTNLELNLRNLDATSKEYQEISGVLEEMATLSKLAQDRLELEQKVLPLIIIRTLPNGLKEKWRVNELLIVN